MTAGFIPTQDFINQQAGQIAVNTRNAILQIVQFNAYLQNLGQDGLVGLGFAAADATALLTIYTNMNSVAELCQGNTYTGPTLPHNFVGDTLPLWGGQLQVRYRQQKEVSYVGP